MSPDEFARRARECLHRDPKIALPAYRDFARHQLPWLEEHVIMSARATGMNWAEIGRLLDRSRQNLHKRFDGLDPRPEPTERESWDTVVRRRDADSMAALEALRHRSTRATSQATDRHGRGAGEDGAP